jgi:hypothetical protein
MGRAIILLLKHELTLVSRSMVAVRPGVEVLLAFFDYHLLVFYWLEI